MFLDEIWPKEDRGDYLLVFADKINVISVFDELRYDRSDADIMSPVMRMHLVKQLKRAGFIHKTGSLLEHDRYSIKCHIPKARALGASPFHITDDIARNSEDFYALTPTQTACQIIKHYDLDEAVKLLASLIQNQPINIYRLSDYLEYEEDKHEFRNVIGHLKYLQRVALESSPLKFRRTLKFTRY